MLLLIYTLLLQELPESLLPSAESFLQVDKEVFELSPTNVYGWLIYGLLGIIGYLKFESTVKSWRLMKKDAYIKELHKQLVDAEKNSITEEEASLYKKIIALKSQAETLEG